MKINKSILIVIGIVVLAVLVYAIFYKYTDNETKILFCGPNQTQPVTVFKNPSKAFPAFTNSYDISARGALTLVEKLKDSAPPALAADARFVEQVVSLREQLNQDNIRMENLLKASFYSFNQDPCDKDIKRRYLDLIDTMTYKALELEKFKASITLPGEKGSTTDNTAILIINKDTSVINRSLEKFKESYFKP